jgi:hypothetical protein
MARCELKLETLKDLNLGAVGLVWDQELAVIMHDLHDRPGVPKARELHVILRVEPISEHGGCEYVRGDVAIFSRLPKRKTRELNFSTDVQGRLIFNSESPDSVDQNTLFGKETASDD